MRLFSICHPPLLHRRLAVSGGSMLQNIRDNSQGWIAKTIIGVIVLLLALTGFDAIFNSVGNRDTVAEVNGEPISERDLAQAVDMQRRQLQQQFGESFDPSLLDDRLLRQSALAGLIDRMLLLQGAKSADFAFSKEALDQLILQTPEFQTEGRFDSARFDLVLQQMGYSRMQFRQLLEQEMLIGQLRAGVTGTAFVTDQQVRQFAQLEQQTRDFSTRTVAAQAEAVEVGKKDIESYYAAHEERFRSPEQVVLDYVVLRKDDFLADVEIDDETVQALYQNRIGNLAEQRRAAHILIEVDSDTDEDAARKRIEAIAGQINAGEDFADVAEEASEDPGSASEGGDLGFAGRGVYDQAFEDALYALQEGEVSEPVRTEFGWHLIKLLGIQAPEVPSLDSLRPELERELRQQEAERRFVEATKDLEDRAFESSDLTQPAEELGLSVQTTEPFGREGGEGIAANRQVIQAAFSDELLTEGTNSNVIELDADTAAVVRVKRHLEPEPLPLAEVEGQIETELRQQKAAEQAKAQGDALLAQLREGGAKSEPDAWSSVEAATRNHEGIEPVVLQAVFRMPKPEDDRPTYEGVTLANGDFVVIELTGVSKLQAELSDDELQQYRRFLSSRAGQQDFASYRKWLEDEAEIDRD